MKIGITTFGGDGGKSGISQYLIQLLKQFSAVGNGHQFDVLGYASEQQLFVPERSRMSSVNFGDHLRNPVLNVAWHQLALRSWTKRRQHDVLFLPAGNRRLPMTSSCPTVGTVHDFSSLHVQGKYDPARMFYITKVLPALIRRLTRVITVSESSKRDIVQYAQVPEHRVVVTPEAVDHQTFFAGDSEESRQRIRTKYELEHPYILYVSRIEHPGKNHVRLIRAFERLKQTRDLPHRLVLAGSDWGRAEEVHRVANESSVVDQIVFTGFVPSGDLPDLYRAADLFVFPSLYEGFGLPILEAMASGTPTTCANISSLPEVAGQAAIMFDPYDEEEITHSMDQLLSDAQQADLYRQRGLTRSQQFNWTATAKQTLGVIETAAEEMN